MPGEHIFCVDSRLLQSMSKEEVKASVADMKEMGLYNFPYGTGPIIIRLVVSNRIYLEARGLRDEDEFVFQYVIVTPKHERDPAFKLGIHEDLTPFFTKLPKLIEGKRAIHPYIQKRRPADCEQADREKLRDFLVLLLATKGTERKTKDLRKLRSIGLAGRDQSAAYVTTIRLSKDLKRGSPSEAKIGFPVRPHLRRGHIRNQHFGTGNAQIKKIWIEPVFVNVDDDFISQRTAYRIVH